jgi:hypothetical protein
MRRHIKTMILAAAMAGTAGTAQAALLVTPTTDATNLANALAGSGVTILSATLSGDLLNGAGTFANAGSTGFPINSGVLLATGGIAGAVGPNNSTGTTTRSGTTTRLDISFTTSTGGLMVNYVFGSEEYYFPSMQFDDNFQLLLDGVNIATLPNGGGVVSVNNVNPRSNSAFYVDNPQGAPVYDLQYDGFTTLLSATATGLATNVAYTLSFIISDLGDWTADSGVFIQANSFTGLPTSVPEPATLALFGAGLLGLGLARRRRRKAG